AAAWPLTCGAAATISAVSATPVTINGRTNMRHLFGQQLSFRLFRRVIRSAGPCRADKQLSPIGKCDVSTIGLVRSILRLIAVDDDLCSRLQGVLGEAAPDKS